MTDSRAGGARRTGEPDDAALYQALQAWSLTRGDAAFVHQHVVDAWTAQHADVRTKPIAVTFALIGLCLHVEHGFPGRGVQKVHVHLAKRRRAWPMPALPMDRGAMTLRDVMGAPAGPEREAAIDRWCASVWAAYEGSRSGIVALLEHHGILPADHSGGREGRRG